jgi:hypothetical protein
MPKPRRTVLSGIVTPFPRDAAPEEAAATEAAPAPPVARRRNAARDALIQQTLYLPPVVHDQLRELAFSERVKMHALIMEGLDAVFRARGMKSIADLNGKS